MADYDEKIYDDTLKATGDEALAKNFAIAYKSVKDLKSAPSDDEKLKVSHWELFCCLLLYPFLFYYLDTYTYLDL